MYVQRRRKHISIGPAPVRAMLALCKETLAMVVLSACEGGLGGIPQEKFGLLGFLRTFRPNVISEDMRVTFAKDLGLTVVYLKIIFILVKSIGPAAAGPAGPVPAPLTCEAVKVTG